MGRFFIGSDCHDDMLGNDGQYRFHIQLQLFVLVVNCIS